MSAAGGADPTAALSDRDKAEFVLGVYFRTQAAIERYMGREGLPEWTDHVARITAESTRARLPDRAEQARSLVTNLATMLSVYGSEMSFSEDAERGEYELEVGRCGIYDYRERARDQGVELTLPTPCEFCVDLRHRTAAHLGLEVSHELGHRSCRWRSCAPRETGAAPPSTGAEGPPSRAVGGGQS